MNKKILIALLILPAFAAFSEEIDMEQVAKERLEWTKKHFAEQGSPVPDGGVTVLPEKQMSEYNSFKKLRAKNREDVKKYGYIKKSSPEIQSLLNFKHIAANQFAGSVSANRPDSDYLRHHISEIEMAYHFRGVPENEMSEMLGVAPSVTYVPGKGWAGAVQFFEKFGVGTCSFRENNVKFSHGATIIPKEDVRKDINGKVTVVTVTGEVGTGFIYGVDWFDETYFRELACANPKYSLDMVSSVIELAKAIDSHG